jgi:peptide chain release factor 1
MFDERNFLEKMATLGRRHEEVSALLGQPEVIARRAEFLKLSREHADLTPLVTAWAAYQKLRSDLAQAKQLADAESDPELREMAREEQRELDARVEPAEQASSRSCCCPRTHTTRKNTIARDPRRHRRRRGRAVRRRPVPHVPALRRAPRLEGRGPEPRRGHRRRLQGGIFLVEGKDVYAHSSSSRACTACSGCRPPRRQGRIHTSAATVAVLPEAEEVDVKIEEKDLRIDVYALERRGRAARQHHRLGGAHHAPPDRHRRHLPGRAASTRTRPRR